MASPSSLTTVPVKLYGGEGRLTVAAPMPGLEPSDIWAEVTAESRLVLHGEQRGAQKGVNDEILNEWEPGPYHREVDLPHPVDGTAANMTYGNGVLVVSLPFSDGTQAAHLVMQKEDNERGMLAGNAGHEQSPTAVQTGAPDTLDEAGSDTPVSADGEDPNAFADISVSELEVDPLDQPIDSDFQEVANDSVEEDDEGDVEPDPIYFPGTDPVITANAAGNYEVLGGFDATADDAISVERSTLDDIPGDAALTDAINDALRRDASTTDLRLRVHVHNGTAFLRGRVADLTDADNAADVAGRIPGVVDVVDETEVANL